MKTLRDKIKNNLNLILKWNNKNKWINQLKSNQKTKCKQWNP